MSERVTPIIAFVETEYSGIEITINGVRLGRTDFSFESHENHMLALYAWLASE